MPSSRPNAIPVVVHILKQLEPQSILDIGVGFGKWGHLFREYTDILHSENEPARYAKENWRVTIDGVEGYPQYLTPMHRFLYDHIYEGDVRHKLAELKSYDMIFLGDIIEHLTMEDGKQLIHGLLEKTNKAVVLSTPKYETSQGDLCDNELEVHHSLWAASDFLEFPNAAVTTVTETMLIAVIAKPGVPMPELRPEIAGRKPPGVLTKARRRVGRALGLR